MSDTGKRDTLFETPLEHSPFAFTTEVAQVFEDMIRRSVPGYALTLEMIAMITAHYAADHSRCYDLGCSLGAATLAMAHSIEKKNCTLIAVDNSRPMLERAQQRVMKASPVPVEFVCEDITQLRIENASVAVMNFTLQFVPEAQKPALLASIYVGLRPGGVLILSEKIYFDDDDEQQTLQALHHGFKRFKGYSDLEISQKRNALEKVLIPDSLETHLQRLQQAGFSRSHVWFQCFNFISLVAFK